MSRQRPNKQQTIKSELIRLQPSKRQLQPSNRQTIKPELIEQQPTKRQLQPSKRQPIDPELIKRLLSKQRPTKRQPIKPLLLPPSLAIFRYFSYESRAPAFSVSSPHGVVSIK